MTRHLRHLLLVLAALLLIAAAATVARAFGLAVAGLASAGAWYLLDDVDEDP